MARAFVTQDDVNEQARLMADIFDLLAKGVIDAEAGDNAMQILLENIHWDSRFKPEAMFVFDSVFTRLALGYFVNEISPALTQEEVDAMNLGHLNELIEAKIGDAGRTFLDNVTIGS